MEDEVGTRLPRVHDHRTRSIDMHDGACLGCSLQASFSPLAHVVAVLRRMFLRINSQLDEQERTASPTNAGSEAILAAARLEGISVAEAVENKRRFRYLY